MLYPDYPDDNENGENTGGEKPEDSGYTADDARPRMEYTIEEDRPWCEARYESPAENRGKPYSPSSTIRGYDAEDDSGGKESKPSSRHSFLKMTAFLLICVIASGFSSYAVASYVVGREKSNLTTQVVIGSSTSQKNTSGDYNTDSEIFTGSEIYAMACNYQVVGVKTSGTSANVFGQTTSSVVSGTGFVISADGYIMTNYHIISNAVQYDSALTVVLDENTSLPAEIVGYVSDNDIAVIKVDVSGLDFYLNPVTIGDSDKMAVGEAVYTVGNPLGELTNSLSDGIVSALDRVITTSDSKTMNMFQITAPVNSGNSGGPVYNSHGEAIGIVTAKYSSTGYEGLGFAIPINDAVSLASQLISKGYVSGASIGVKCLDVDDAFTTFVIEYYNYPYGACVIEVNPDSAAEKAGIVAGDIITSINGQNIASIDELKMCLRKVEPGDAGTMTIYRMNSTLGGGETLELEIVFDETSVSETEGESEESSDTGSSITPWYYYFGG